MAVKLDQMAKSLLLCSMVISVLSSRAYADTPENELTIKSALLARLEKLQSIQATFDLDVQFQHGPTGNTLPTPPKGVTIAAFRPTGEYKLSSFFSFLRGEVRYEERLSEETIKSIKSGLSVYPLIHIHSISSDRSEMLELRIGDRDPSCVVEALQEGARYESESVIDVALGLRVKDLAGGMPVWTNDEEIKSASIQTPDDDRVILTFPNTMKTNNYEWTYSRKLGYALTQFQMINIQSKQSAIVITNDDFHAIDGIMLPFKIIQIRYTPDKAGEWKQDTKETLTISKYDIGASANSHSSYYIAWPKKGTRVTDLRTNVRLTTDKDLEVLDDDTIARLILAKKLSQQRAESQPATQK